MKTNFVELARDLCSPVRTRRQKKLHEVEAAWTIDDLTNFRSFVAGLHPAEKINVCIALSDAQTIPFLEILADFAEGEAELMQTAFKAMEKISTLSRVFLAEKLLNSKNVKARVNTCKILEDCGELAKSPLEKALNDPNPKVQTAAICAVYQNGLESLAKKIIPYLQSDDKETRLTALSAIANFDIPISDIEDNAIKILLDENEDVKTRQIAAGILSNAKNAKARSIFINAVKEQNTEHNLRMIAADALANYDDLQAVMTMLETTFDSNTDISKTAYRAINKKNTEKYAKSLASCMDNADIRISEIAAKLLGGFDIEFAEKPLLQKLKNEKRLDIYVAIAKSLDSIGSKEAWNALESKLKEYGASVLLALADVAKEDDIPKFASLFNEAESDGQKRIIIEKLAEFAQTAPIDDKTIEIALNIFEKGIEKFYFPAAVILAHSQNCSKNPYILEALADNFDNPMTSNAINAILRGNNGALANVFGNTSPKTACLVLMAAKNAVCVGDKSLFQKLASWARNNEPFAKEALWEMASLEPELLIEAMFECPDQAFLIEAWSRLPVKKRLAHRPDLESFFMAASQNDCLFVLNILENLHESWCLSDIISIVFNAKNETAREKAASLVQEIFFEDA